MYYILSKLLPLFVLPPGSFFILAIISYLLMRRGWRNIGRMLFIFAFVMLYLCSTPALSTWLIMNWENRYESANPGEKKETAVILGGMFDLDPRAEVWGHEYQALDAVDRVLEGIQLKREGMVQKLLLTAGKSPFTPGQPSEAEIIRRFIRQYSQIPDSVLIIEDRAINTEQNAFLSASIMEQRNLSKDVYLVTSALHMPRAVYVFEKAGFNVHPHPTDFQSLSELSLSSGFVWIPNASALQYSTKVIREMLGYYYYKMKY